MTAEYCWCDAEREAWESWMWGLDIFAIYDDPRRVRIWGSRCAYCRAVSAADSEDRQDERRRLGDSLPGDPIRELDDHGYCEHGADPCTSCRLHYPETRGSIA